MPIISVGRQISAREIGLVGSYGDKKLQPFMVAFFRNLLPSVDKQPGQQLHTSLTEKKDDDYGEEDGIVRRSRVRRQTPNNNRKRSKDSEEFGSWNPYAGKTKNRFYMSYMISKIILYN